MEETPTPSRQRLRTGDAGRSRDGFLPGTGGGRAESGREWRWAAAWSVSVAAAALLPYVAASWMAPAGHAFSGFLANPVDGFSYLAKMRQAASGAWLLSLPYTAEPHSPIFIYPQYVLLGKLTGLTGWPPLLVYHGSRLFACLLMLGTAYALVAAVLAPGPVRRTAFVLLSTAGGLSWLTSLWGTVAADAGIQVSTTFHALFSNMHFPLATALLILPLLLLLRGIPSPSGRALTAAAASNGLLAVIAPFLLVTQAAVGLLWGALAALRGLLTPSPRLLFLLMVPALPAAAVAAQALLNPAMAGWTAQNLIPAPEPWSFALGYVPLLPVAVVGAAATVRGQTGLWAGRAAALLVLLWAAAGPLLVYLPFPWQRRLMQGYDIPLAILAAVGLHALMSRLGPAAARRLRLGYLSFAMLGNLWLVFAALLGAQALREPHYLSHQDLAALAWLADHATRDDVVLASPTIGNIIPASSDARVYWGHPFETLDSDAKLGQVRRFYTLGVSEAERCAIAGQAGASLVYRGPVEQRMGPAPLDQHPWLVPAFRADPVTIYRVRRCEVLASNGAP